MAGVEEFHLAAGGAAEMAPVVAAGDEDPHLSAAQSAVRLEVVHGVRLVISGARLGRVEHRVEDRGPVPGEPGEGHGQPVRVRVRERQNVLLVPQRAVTELQGAQSVFTVGAGDKAESRTVVLGERTGSNWIVEQGLKPGDRVVLDGIMTMRPGALLKPEPAKN